MLAPTEDVVTPHASFLALDVLPQQAFDNIQSLTWRYPGIYGPYGFFNGQSYHGVDWTSLPGPSP